MFVGWNYRTHTVVVINTRYWRLIQLLHFINHMTCCCFSAETSVLAPVWLRFCRCFTSVLSSVISKDVKSSNPSAVLPANFPPTFLFPIPLTCWFTSVESHVFIVPWQTLTPAVRLVIGKWMQTRRPCRVSRKLILECLHDVFRKNARPNQKLQSSGLNRSRPAQSHPLSLFSAHLKTGTYAHRTRPWPRQQVPRDVCPASHRKYISTPVATSLRDSCPELASSDWRWTQRCLYVLSSMQLGDPLILTHLHQTGNTQTTAFNCECTPVCYLGTSLSTRKPMYVCMCACPSSPSATPLPPFSARFQCICHFLCYICSKVSIWCTGLDLVASNKLLFQCCLVQWSSPQAAMWLAAWLATRRTIH